MRIIDHLNATNRADGQGLAEYAIILAFVVILIVAALLFVGDQIADLLSSMASGI